MDPQMDSIAKYTTQKVDTNSYECSMGEGSQAQHNVTEVGSASYVEQHWCWKERQCLARCGNQSLVTTNIFNSQ